MEFLFADTILPVLGIWCARWFEHSFLTLFVKVSGDRLVNALQPQWGAVVLHTRTYCRYLFRLAAFWKKKTVFFFYASIASDIEMSWSFVSRPTFRKTEFHLVNRSFDFKSSVSLGILDRFTSLASESPCRWTKTPRTRKEGRNEGFQAAEPTKTKLCASLGCSCLHGGSVFAPRVFFFFVQPEGRVCSTGPRRDGPATPAFASLT